MEEHVRKRASLHLRHNIQDAIKIKLNVFCRFEMNSKCSNGLKQNVTWRLVYNRSRPWRWLLSNAAASVYFQIVYNGTDKAPYIYSDRPFCYYWLSMYFLFHLPTTFSRSLMNIMRFVRLNATLMPKSICFHVLPHIIKLLIVATLLSSLRRLYKLDTPHCHFMQMRFST